MNKIYLFIPLTETPRLICLPFRLKYKRKNFYRSGFKTAFVTRMSDIYSRKAEVQNRRRRSQNYVEDEF